MLADMLQVLQEGPEVFYRVGFRVGPLGQIRLRHPLAEAHEWLYVDKGAFSPGGHLDWVTLVLGVAAFLVLTFWKWRLNVVAVVLGGGALGLLRAFVPSLFGATPS